MNMVTIIKRKGQIEQFDPEKLELTIIRAALNSHLSDEEGRRLASEVLRQIQAWLENRGQITSQELFEKTIGYLAEINKEVSFMYKTHREIC